MSGSQRGFSAIGSDNPFVQLAVPLKQGTPNQNTTINYPHEINMFKEQLFDIFEKLITLRNQFQKTLENPSVKESQKVGLKKSILRIDTINKKLLEVPEFLTLFSVDT